VHHPLKHPRTAALVGILFVAIGVIYWIAPGLDGMMHDSDGLAAGTTMLVFLGVAMAIMAYVLVAGSTEE
jgi:heme/copper-type cytochrome/quinol oxidase subunit 1